MVERLEISDFEKYKYLQTFPEFPTLFVNSLHFMGIRYDEPSAIMVLVFEMVVDDKIYEFDVCLSYTNADKFFFDNNCSDWIINNKYIPTDSLSINALYMAESPYLIKNENNTHDLYMIHCGGRDMNIILTYNYYFMIEHIIYCLRSFRCPKKEIIDSCHYIDHCLYYDSIDFDKTKINKIFIDKKSINDSLCTVFILININDINIIFKADIVTSKLNRSIFKQNIVSKDINMLDAIYDKSCYSENENGVYYITGTDRILSINYKKCDDENEQLIEYNKIVAITEQDDFHELTAIILDSKFLYNLENYVSKIIDSKLY